MQQLMHLDPMRVQGNQTVLVVAIQEDLKTFTPLLRPSEAMSSTPSAQSSLVVQAPLVQLSIHVAGSDVTVHRNSPPSEDDGSSDYELIP